MVVSNVIESNSVMPSLHHSSAESDYYLVRQITTDLSSASTSRAVHAFISAGGIRSVIPAASPYYPQDINPLSRGENKKDPTSSKCHVCCESGKKATAALPDHIMNAVPHSQKGHYPVHLVSVPSNTSPRNTPGPCHAANLNGQSCSTNVYNTWDARQPVSANTSQSRKTNGKVQYTSGYASSQARASDGLNKIQYSCQFNIDTSAPNRRIDTMNSVHQETPPWSKSNTLIVAPPRHPDYVAQTVCQPVSGHGLVTSNLRYKSMNGHVPAEPNNVFRSANSAFQEQRKSQGAPYSSVNSCSAPKQQPRNENSADYFKHGSPSSWSNVSRNTSSNMTCTTKDYPAVLTRDQRVCDSLTTTKGPHCYISLDSMPQGDRKKDESKLAEVATRCREMVQPREDRMPGIDQEQPAKKLENFTKFVVGVETRLHWEKIRNDSENSNTSKEQDMQIVSVSSTHSPHDDPTEMHSNSSQNESDDAFFQLESFTKRDSYYSLGKSKEKGRNSSYEKTDLSTREWQ